MNTILLTLTVAALHWTAEHHDGVCSEWKLYDAHRKVAAVIRCVDETGHLGDYIIYVGNDDIDQYDDLGAAKERAEEEYKRRNREKAK